MKADVVSEVFETNVLKYDELRIKAENRHRQIGLLRLLVIVLSIAGVFVAYPEWPWLSVASAVVGSAAFIALIKLHRKTGIRRRHFEILRDINQREKGLTAHLTTEEDTTEYGTQAHSYASDIDLFGKHSIFSFANRCAWEKGRRLLADWLLAPADKAEILLRQQSVSELREMVEWRQNLEAMAKQFEGDSRVIDYQSPVPVPTYLKWAAYVLFPITIALTIGVLFFDIRYSFLVAIAMLNIGLNVAAHYKAKKHLEQFDKSASHFRALHGLAKHIEGQVFSSERLKTLVNKFVIDEKPASELLNDVKGLVENLEMRNNSFFFLVANGFLFWDIYWLSRLDKWLTTYGQHIAVWEDAHAEFEALGSLAGLYYQNQEWTMPEITDELQLSATDMGHLLIKKQDRVCNDVELNGAGEIMLVTGSNMAGKSTYLRTVATNVTLALAGAPVCAARMKLSPLQLFTCMRINDDLAEGASAFYAELSRIAKLLELTEKRYPVLFFLDEILKGTNSADRHAGARALILQLSERNCMGMVSTHDLELGQLEQEEGVKVTNYSFESTIINGQISFDYKLKSGLCHSFNAVQLMSNMGIRMPDELLLK